MSAVAPYVHVSLHSNHIISPWWLIDLGVVQRHRLYKRANPACFFRSFLVDVGCRFLVMDSLRGGVQLNNNVVCSIFVPTRKYSQLLCFPTLVPDTVRFTCDPSVTAIVLWRWMNSAPVWQKLSYLLLQWWRDWFWAVFIRILLCRGELPFGTFLPSSNWRWRMLFLNVSAAPLLIRSGFCLLSHICSFVLQKWPDEFRCSHTL